MWRAATFKRLSATSRLEREAIVSFGTSIARMVVSAVRGRDEGSTSGLDPSTLRDAILRSAPFVGLGDLLALCWGLGIPVLHMTVTPLRAKRMSAMSVGLLNRYVILTTRHSRYAAQLAYYVAHELGHIALGHMREQAVYVDLGELLPRKRHRDVEEDAADRFALQLLTGDPDLQVLPKDAKYSGASLAKTAMAAAADLRIEPGILALCVGHGTGRWRTTFAALQRIYPKAEGVGALINRIAIAQIPADMMSQESEEFLRGAMGLA